MATPGDGGSLDSIPGDGDPPMVTAGLGGAMGWNNVQVNATSTDGGTFKSVRNYWMHNNGLHVKATINHTGFGACKMAAPTLYNRFKQRFWGEFLTSCLKTYYNYPWQYVDRYDTPYVRTHLFIKVVSAGENRFPLKKHDKETGATRRLYFRFDDISCSVDGSFGDDGNISMHGLICLYDIWKYIWFDFSGTYAGSSESGVKTNVPNAGKLNTSSSFHKWRPVPNKNLDIELVLYVPDVVMSSWKDDADDRRYQGEVPEFYYWWKQARLLFILSGMSLGYFTSEEVDAANKGDDL